jgi:aldehyde dehydrogenase (NAD+)
MSSTLAFAQIPIEDLLTQLLPTGVHTHAGGQPITGTGRTVEVRDPATGRLVGEWSDTSVAGADAACDAATVAAPGWQRLGAFGRAAVLRRVGDAIADHAEDLAVLEAASAGKPIRDCRGEVAKVAEMFHYYSGWADKIAGQTLPVPGDWLTYTRREPYGVVLAITPWNAPLFTAAWNTAPALAAGNTVVIKPSEYTPHTTLRMVQIAEAAGLPDGVLNVACGYGATIGDALVNDDRISKITFVGSVPTGRSVAARAAARGVPSLLELGGKSANIIFDDADLAAAVHGAVTGIFLGAGQSCVAGSRLLVHDSVYDKVVERLVAVTQELPIGQPLHEGTVIGPLGNQSQLHKVRDLLQIAQSEGGVLLTDPDRLPGSLNREGYWVAPTIVGGVQPEHTLENTEAFGPVLALAPFTDEDEAIERANQTAFGLAGAVWTSNVSRAHRIASQLDAGTVWINAYKTIHVAAPFGGVGGSGWGRSSGPDALSEYTQSKCVWTPIASDPIGCLPQVLP